MNERPIIFSQDGDMICAKFKDFVNLQESPVGFGSTYEEAQQDLLRQVGTTMVGG